MQYRREAQVDQSSHDEESPITNHVNGGKRYESEIVADRVHGNRWLACKQRSVG